MVYAILDTVLVDYVTQPYPLQGHCLFMCVAATSTQSTNHANVLASPVTIIANQAAIG